MTSGGRTHPQTVTAGGVGALAATGALAIVAALGATSKWGVALSPDSVHYMAAAEGLARGEGYHRYTGQPCATWPPGLAAVLAVGVRCGIDAATTARYVNALAFGLTVWLAGYWTRQRTGRLPAGVLVGWLLAVSPLVAVSRWLVSEPLFILLTFAFVWRARDLAGSDRLRSVVLPALLACAATMTRYAGLACVPVGVGLVLACRPVAFRRRLRHSLVFAAVSLGPVAGWLTRNWLVTGTLTGPRGGGRTLADVMRQSVDAVWNLALSGKAAPLATRTAVVAGGVACLLVLGLVRLGMRRRGTPPDADRTLGVIPLFCACYVLLMVHAYTTASIDSVNNRILAPLYAPLVCFVAISLCDLTRAFADRRQAPSAGRRCLVRTGVGLVVFGLGLVTWKTAVVVRQWAREGAGGYTTATWRQSPLLEALRRHPPEGQILSNHPDAIWLFLRKRASLGPPTNALRDPEALERRLHAQTRGQPAVLVYFRSGWRDYIATPEALEALGLLEVVMHRADGSIYKLTLSVR